MSNQTTTPALPAAVPPAPALKTPGTFNPARVGTHGYPSSLESYRERQARLLTYSQAAKADGKLTRKGSRNGRPGEREAVLAERAAALLTARAAVDRHILAELTPAQRKRHVPTGEPDGHIGHEALAQLLAVTISSAWADTERLWAAQAILPFLRVKPKGEPAVGLTTALGFLDDLLGLQGVKGGIGAPKAR